MYCNHSLNEKVLCHLIGVIFSVFQSPGKEGMDVYDTLLTQAEIQGNLNMTNDAIRKKKAEEARKFGRIQVMH